MPVKYQQQTQVTISFNNEFCTSLHTEIFTNKFSATPSMLFNIFTFQSFQILKVKKFRIEERKKKIDSIKTLIICQISLFQKRNYALSMNFPTHIMHVAYQTMQSSTNLSCYLILFCVHARTYFHCQDKFSSSLRGWIPSPPSLI